jgi:hypothetical protein
LRNIVAPLLDRLLAHSVFVPSVAIFYQNTSDGLRLRVSHW